jgi:acetyl-CoA carboxylase carboxyl transferase subunit alpha
MGITSDRVREQGFLDEVIREPIGGGHRNFLKVALSLRETLLRHLDELCDESKNMDLMLEKRYQRIMRFGSYLE